MLAKYIPGGVWTPAARVVALRRFGVRETPVVLASILLEAGFSAVAGVGVFLVGLAIVGSTDAPLLPLVAFGVLVAILLYPVVFETLARRLLRPFGAHAVMPLPARTAFSLLGVLRAHVAARRGGPLLPAPRRSAGIRRSRRSRSSAVRAPSARSSPCSSVFAPSGLGVREASVYGLLLTVVGEGVALGATILNRLAITLVEAALLLDRRAADPLAPCRTAARARRRARLARLREAVAARREVELAAVLGTRTERGTRAPTARTSRCPRAAAASCARPSPRRARAAARARRRSGTRSSSSRPRSTRRAGARPRVRGRRSPARSG